MRCLARVAIRNTYLFSLLIGMLSFEFDFRRQRLRLTRRAVIYAGVVNVSILGVIPLIFYWNLWYDFGAHASLLHQKLFMLISLVRAASVFVTFIGNWRQRREFIAVFREFLQLHRQHFRNLYVREQRASALLERAVWRKYLAVTLSELLIFAVSLRAIPEMLTLRLAIGVFGISSVMAMLNLAFTHYYFAVLQVRVHYQLIRFELAAIVADAKAIVAKRDERSRQAGRGLGVYITQCCQLADRLDVLAVAERRLHNVCDRINAMYATQGICIACVFYLTSMSIAYYLFYVIKYDDASIYRSYWGIAVIIAAALAYYKDLHISLFVMFNTIDLHRECAEVLRQYLQLPVLDPRLQMSFEALTLQMQNRPIVFDMLGLLKFEKITVFAIFGDFVQHIILLIQDDMKNKNSNV